MTDQNERPGVCNQRVISHSSFHSHATLASLIYRPVLPTCSHEQPKFRSNPSTPKFPLHILGRHPWRRKGCVWLSNTRGIPLKQPPPCLIISTLHCLHFDTANNTVQTSILKTGALQCMLEFSPHRPRSFFSQTFWAFRLYLYKPPIPSMISSNSCWPLRPSARTRSDQDSAIGLYSFHSTRKPSIEGTLQSSSNGRVGNRKLSIEGASKIVQ